MTETYPLWLSSRPYWRQYSPIPSVPVWRILCATFPQATVRRCGLCAALTAVGRSPINVETNTHTTQAQASPDKGILSNPGLYHTQRYKTN